MKDKAIEMSRSEMVKNPQMTEEMMEMSTKVVSKGWNFFMVGGALLGTLFMGAIFALIAGAIAKKKVNYQ